MSFPSPLRVVFMGTPDFAVPALQAILHSPHNVICVYTQPPRGKGRGQTVQKSPVHEAAEAAGVDVRHPLSFKKDPAAQADFAALGADVAVVAAYGLILPQAVLDAPRFGCINIHASLLPRWRGASPIQRAVWAGDKESGVTIMQMEAGLDTGPMIEKGIVHLPPETTTQTLHDDLARMGGAMILPVLDRLAAQGFVASEKQDDSQSTYAPMLTKDDGRVDWVQPAEAIDRQIRALNPWPGVWTMAGEKRLKIIEASLSQDSAKAAPGTVLDRAGHIACGGGTVLQLRIVQPENGKRMDAAAAINGQHIRPGALLA